MRHTKLPLGHGSPLRAGGAASRASRFGLAALLAVSLLALYPAMGMAAPPSNDNLAGATPVVSLPFTDHVDMSEATTEPGESGVCSPSGSSVWYSITPATSGAVQASVSGGFPIVSIYQRTGPGFFGLQPIVSCAFFASPVFNVQAGATYLVQAVSGFGGAIDVALSEVPPPANDNFAAATTASALPFSDTVDLTAATTEPGEPLTPNSGFPPMLGSAWYEFTPTLTESLTARANVCCSGASLAVYTGSEVGNLTQVAASPGNSLVFTGVAGVTYRFQLGRLSPGGQTLGSFSLEVAPPPSVGFFTSPFDPSVFDTVQFFDNSFDPAGGTIQSRAWDFGDGTTGVSSNPTHTYAKDGDYSVKLTVTTADGRTATGTQVVSVRTHDVAITKLTAPKAARAGTTQILTIHLANTRIPETVQVDLYKSSPSGFQLIGTTTQGVPVRGPRQTTDFKINYTFTSADAAIGKVTFRAVATLIGARDALPGDNEAVAAPTKVNP